MWKPRWLFAIPLALAATAGPANAATVRDRAGLFTPDAVQKAQAELDRVEGKYQIPVTVETIDSLEGENISDVARRHARESGKSGLFILIAKKEARIDVLSSQSYAHALNGTRKEAIRSAFVSEFKLRDFDAGLLNGVKAVGTEVAAAASENGGLRQNAPGGRPGPGGSARPSGREPARQLRPWLAARHRPADRRRAVRNPAPRLVVRRRSATRRVSGSRSRSRWHADGRTRLRRRLRRSRGRLHVEPLRRDRRRDGRQLALRPVLGPTPPGRRIRRQLELRPRQRRHRPDRRRRVERRHRCLRRLGR